MEGRERVAGCCKVKERVKGVKVRVGKGGRVKQGEGKGKKDVGMGVGKWERVKRVKVRVGKGDRV